MPFPEANRYIYRRNPLKQVICQLKYPEILRIDTEQPSQFQEVVRHKFPVLVDEQDGATFPLPEPVSELIPHELLLSLQRTQNRRFQFRSRDKNWIISLTKDFVALETSAYVRWEQFRDNVKLVIRALEEAYAATYLIRIGLRYRNVIDRKALELDAIPWGELLTSSILGPLDAPPIIDEILEHHGTFLLQLDDERDVVRIQHGLATDETADTGNFVYLLDHDFFTKNDVETEIRDVVSRFDLFNLQNRRLFSWCIKDKLHDAMDPGPV